MLQRTLIIKRNWRIVSDEACALSFTTLYYSLRKILTREQRLDVLNQLREALDVAYVGASVIDMALRQSRALVWLSSLCPCGVSLLQRLWQDMV